MMCNGRCVCVSSRLYLGTGISRVHLIHGHGCSLAASSWEVARPLHSSGGLCGSLQFWRLVRALAVLALSAVLAALAVLAVLAVRLSTGLAVRLSAVLAILNSCGFTLAACSLWL